MKIQVERQNLFKATGYSVAWSGIPMRDPALKASERERINLTTYDVKKLPMMSYT